MIELTKITLNKGQESGKEHEYLRVIPPQKKKGKVLGQQEYIMREEKEEQNNNTIQQKDVR